MFSRLRKLGFEQQLHHLNKYLSHHRVSVELKMHRTDSYFSFPHIAACLSHYSGGRVTLRAIEHWFLSVPQLQSHLCWIPLCCSTLKITGLGPTRRCADVHPSLPPSVSSIPPRTHTHTHPSSRCSDPSHLKFLQALQFFRASAFLTGEKRKRCITSCSAQVSGFDHFALVLRRSRLCPLFQAATQITHILVIISII